MFSKYKYQIEDEISRKPRSGTEGHEKMNHVLKGVSSLKEIESETMIDRRKKNRRSIMRIFSSKKNRKDSCTEADVPIEKTLSNNSIDSYDLCGCIRIMTEEESRENIRKIELFLKQSSSYSDISNPIKEDEAEEDYAI